MYTADDVRQMNNQKIEEIKGLLPTDVWSWAQNEVLNSGNQGIWAMCLAAIEKLSEFWQDNPEQR